MNLRHPYYDRQGKPITMEEWAGLFGRLPYKIVRQELLRNGFMVSTVWLGLDHRWLPDGPPLIFETMVFPPGGWGELATERYSTEQEAIAGHSALVREWRMRPNKRIKKRVLKKKIGRAREDRKKLHKMIKRRLPAARTRRRIAEDMRKLRIGPTMRLLQGGRHED